jgi:hypothetical protein
VARSLDLPGPIATVTAGWQDREPEDVELDALLDGRSANLRLYARWQDVLERDPEYASAELEHRAGLAEQRELHIVQLDGALGALREVARRGGGRPSVREAASADAEAVVRLVDERHLARVREATAAFEERWRPWDRGPVTEHRAQVRGALEAVSALVVAGGHVGLLLHLLRLFDVVVPATVIAWSAGAMALTERVLLFHDKAPQPPVHAEFLAAGLGVVPGCVLLPHARRRLRTDDAARMSELTCRAAPALCVVLDDEVRLDLDAAGTLPAGARVIGADGRISDAAVPEPAR